MLNSYRFGTIIDISTITGIKQAYSFRLLSSTYTGALAKFRRASDNATQDFSAPGGLSTFIDWAAVDSWAGGAFYIDTWYDQSGNGYHISNATLADQPAVSTAGGFTNTRSAYFDGTGDCLWHDTLGSTAFCSSQFMLLAALKPVSSAFSTIAIVANAPTTSTTAHFRLNLYTNNARLYWTAALATDITYAVNTLHQLYCSWDGVNASFDIDNGTEIGSVAIATSNDEGSFLMGASTNAAAHPWEGYMAEWIWIDATPNITTADFIRNNQNRIFTLY